jgi:dihydroorotase-like cyclic amidohydrolase
VSPATAVVGGTLVGPDGSAAGDVLIRDGVIAAVGRVDRTGA